VSRVEYDYTPCNVIATHDSWSYHEDSYAKCIQAQDADAGFETGEKRGACRTFRTSLRCLATRQSWGASLFSVHSGASSGLRSVTPHSLTRPRHGIQSIFANAAAMPLTIRRREVRYIADCRSEPVPTLKAIVNVLDIRTRA
jgi:hypothetical protein